jgi:hypothetical protein
VVIALITAVTAALALAGCGDATDLNVTPGYLIRVSRKQASARCLPYLVDSRLASSRWSTTIIWSTILERRVRSEAVTAECDAYIYTGGTLRMYLGDR